MWNDIILTYAGLLAGPAYLAAILSALSDRRYSHRRQFLSELGAPPSPSSVVFNIGLVPPAFCSLRLPTHGLEDGGAVIATEIAVFGGMSAVMGMFPCDPGCPPAPVSRSVAVHALSGLIGSVAIVAATLPAGWHYRSSHPLCACCSFAIAVTSLGMLWRLMASSSTYKGAVQRVFVAIVFSWMAATAWMLLRLS